MFLCTFMRLLSYTILMASVRPVDIKTLFVYKNFGDFSKQEKNNGKTFIPQNNARYYFV